MLHSSPDLAVAIGNLTDRQGRYYRRAAEVLGFAKREGGNHSKVTASGRAYASAPQALKRELFIQAVLNNPLFQRLLPFLEAKGTTGATRADLEMFLGQVATLGAVSMVQRRVSSYVQWLVKLDLANLVGGSLVLRRLPKSVPLINYGADDEPIFPNRYDLKEYEEQARRTAERREAIQFYVDQAARERAVASHQTLVNLMAERLRQHGAVPKANRYIDLSARLSGIDYLFEMKSTTDTNPHAQIRRGISQLYEYRYIQKIESPRLVLVIEQPLSAKFSWMRDYLIEDRGILLAWDGDGKFSCPKELASELPFLS